VVFFLGEAATAAEAPSPTPKPAAPAGPTDATHWQERAQKLQETLDDPQKLEAYFTQKAQHEYDTAAVESIDLNGTPLRGPASAPVKVVEYSDFLCPFCRNLAGALVQFIPQAGGRLAVYFKNYPLDAECNPKLKQSTHPGACRVALGAVCAHRQGKFWEAHDRLLAATGDFTPEAAEQLAKDLGLDVATFMHDLRDRSPGGALALMQEDLAVIEVFRGSAPAPLFFVNGRYLDGKTTLEDLERLVQEEKTKAQAFLGEKNVVDETQLYDAMIRTWRGFDRAQNPPPPEGAGGQ